MKVKLTIDGVNAWSDLDLVIAKGIIRDKMQDQLLNVDDSIELKLVVSNIN